MKTVTAEGARSFTLDAIRGVAALLVLAEHTRNFVIQDWGRATHHVLFEKAFYAVTSIGHQAVIVFFALSGYLVGAGIIRKMSEEGAFAGRTMSYVD